MKTWKEEQEDLFWKNSDGDKWEFTWLKFYYDKVYNEEVDKELWERFKAGYGLKDIYG